MKTLKTLTNSKDWCVTISVPASLSVIGRFSQVFTITLHWMNEKSAKICFLAPVKHFHGHNRRFRACEKGYWKVF